VQGIRRDQGGQSTVELALALPVLALILAALVEAGMIGLDQIRLWHAAREAARIAVVDPDPEEIRATAERGGLRNLEMRVDPLTSVRTAGEPLSVTLGYRPDGHIPIFGDALFRGVTLEASATMRIEQP
jgi:hypothetical protein